MNTVAQTATNYNDWMEAEARAAFADDQRRYAPAPSEVFTPRPGAPVRYSHYLGLEGYLTVDANMMPLFRTSGTSWLPVSSFSELIILAEVGDFECSLALDRAAGDLATIACSRQNAEVA